MLEAVVAPPTAIAPVPDGGRDGAKSDAFEHAAAVMWQRPLPPVDARTWALQTPMRAFRDADPRWEAIAAELFEEDLADAASRWYHPMALAAIPERTRVSADTGRRRERERSRLLLRRWHDGTGVVDRGPNHHPEDPLPRPGPRSGRSAFDLTLLSQRRDRVVSAYGEALWEAYFDSQVETDQALADRLHLSLATWRRRKKAIQDILGAP